MVFNGIFMASFPVPLMLDASTKPPLDVDAMAADPLEADEPKPDPIKVVVFDGDNVCSLD